MSPKIRRISLGGLPEVRLGGEHGAYPKPAIPSPSSSEGSASAVKDAKIAALATRLEKLEAKLDALHVKLDAIIDHLGVDRD